MKQARLIAMAGLPGSRKSTIAEALSHRLPAVILSVDPIEAALRRSGLPKRQIGRAGYEVAGVLAVENLKRGHSVIIDAVNPVQEARNMWTQMAEAMTAQLVFIEVVCSDETEHRQRIDARVRGIAGLTEVSWARVLDRMQDYEPWAMPRLVLDTANTDLNALVRHALETLQQD